MIASDVPFDTGVVYAPRSENDGEYGWYNITIFEGNIVYTPQDNSEPFRWFLFYSDEKLNRKYHLEPLVTSEEFDEWYSFLGDKESYRVSDDITSMRLYRVFDNPIR